MTDTTFVELSAESVELINSSLNAFGLKDIVQLLVPIVSLILGYYISRRQTNFEISRRETREISDCREVILHDLGAKYFLIGYVKKDFENVLKLEKGQEMETPRDISEFHDNILKDFSRQVLLKAFPGKQNHIVKALYGLQLAVATNNPTLCSLKKEMLLKGIQGTNYSLETLHYDIKTYIKSCENFQLYIKRLDPKLKDDIEKEEQLMQASSPTVPLP